MLLLLALGGLFGLALRDFGAPDGRDALQAPLAITAWALGLGLVGGALVRLVQLGRRRSREDGRYLLKGELVERAGERLRVWSLEHLRESRVIEDTTREGRAWDLRLVFADGHQASFSFPTREQARRLAAEVEGMAAMLEDARAEVDIGALERVLIFAETGPRGPAAEAGPYRSGGGGGMRWAAPRRSRAALIAGLTLALLGPGAWWARNRLSDDASFDRARRVGTVRGWLRYLGGEGRHAEAVREVHLPRARFEAARREGPDALRRFVQARPSSPHREDAEAILGRLASEEAQRQAARLQERLAAVRSEPALQPVLEEELLRLRDDPATTLSVGHALRGPTAEERMRLEAIFRRPANAGLLGPMGERFGPEMARAVDGPLRAELEAWLARWIPEERLRFASEQAFADEGGPRLRLEVVWSVQPTGTVYTVRRAAGTGPATTLQGLAVMVTVRLAPRRPGTPGEGGGARFERSVALTPPPELRMESSSLIFALGAEDGRAYRELVVGALEGLDEALTRDAP
mgnify:CR=1 FL=1